MDYLTDKKLRHFHVPGYRAEWIAVIVINHGLDLLNKFGVLLYQKQSEWAFQAAEPS